MHGKKKKLVNFEDIIIETIRNERQIEKTKEALMERRGDNKIVINNGNNKCQLSNFCPWPCTMPLSVLSLTSKFLEVGGIASVPYRV